MGKYQKILVALDGSERSKHAYEETLKFVKETKAKILTIAVMPTHRELVSSLSVFGHVKELIKKPYIKALEEAKELAEEDGIDIKTFFEEGKPYEKIIEIAQKEGCDLIVTGRRGVTSFEKILIGSVAHRIINYSPIDVLIIPKYAKVSFKKILAATDLSEEGNKAVKKAGKIAKNYNGEVGIISVIKLPVEPIIDLQEIIEELKKEIENHLISLANEITKEEVKVEILVREGEPHTVIVNTAKEIEATSIAIGAYSPLTQKSIGSVGEKIIANANCSILVIKS